MSAATSDFDFALPAELIAQRPLRRGTSRLLFLPRSGALEHRRFSDLPALLRPGDRLVVNDTRVLPCRLIGRRRDAASHEPTSRNPAGQDSGGRVEALLTERISAARWWALLKPGRRLRPGGRLTFHSLDGNSQLYATIEERHDERFQLSFEGELGEDLESALEHFGHIPLPPYIRRSDEQQDREDYQTTFARSPGAIAAPTAGLHFTPQLIEQLAARQIALSAITLHVGPATFRPVTEDLVGNHRLGSERFSINEQAAQEISATRKSGGRIVAVGTTSVRALESSVGTDGQVAATSGSTELFVLPGYRFRIVDLLITNFHLPRSTLLMLVSAFAGKRRVLNAYRSAVAGGYRFYSYGDAMLAEAAALAESDSAPRIRQAQAAAP